MRNPINQIVYLAVKAGVREHLGQSHEGIFESCIIPICSDMRAIVECVDKVIDEEGGNTTYEAD